MLLFIHSDSFVHKGNNACCECDGVVSDNIRAVRVVGARIAGRHLPLQNGQSPEQGADAGVQKPAQEFFSRRKWRAGNGRNRDGLARRDVSLGHDSGEQFPERRSVLHRNGESRRRKEPEVEAEQFGNDENFLPRKRPELRRNQRQGRLRQSQSAFVPLQRKNRNFPKREHALHPSQRQAAAAEGGQAAKHEVRVRDRVVHREQQQNHVEHAQAENQIQFQGTVDEQVSHRDIFVPDVFVPVLRRFARNLLQREPEKQRLSEQNGRVDDFVRLVHKLVQLPAAVQHDDPDFADRDDGDRARVPGAVHPLGRGGLQQGAREVHAAAQHQPERRAGRRGLHFQRQNGHAHLQQNGVQVQRHQREALQPLRIQLRKGLPFPKLLESARPLPQLPSRRTRQLHRTLTRQHRAPQRQQKKRVPLLQQPQQLGLRQESLHQRKKIRRFRGPQLLRIHQRTKTRKHHHPRRTRQQNQIIYQRRRQCDQKATRRRQQKINRRQNTKLRRQIQHTWFANAPHRHENVERRRVRRHQKQYQPAQPQLKSEQRRNSRKLHFKPRRNRFAFARRHHRRR